MAKQAKRMEGEPVDQASVESFPASDPPSWTLGSSGATPAPPPGTLAAPAPHAALSFSPDAGPSPADLLSRMASADSALLWAGSVAAATGFVLTLVGQDRLGRAFGQGGVALMLVGVLRRLGQAAGRSTTPSIH